MFNPEITIKQEVDEDNVREYDLVDPEAKAIIDNIALSGLIEEDNSLRLNQFLNHKNISSVVVRVKSECLSDSNESPEDPSTNDPKLFDEGETATEPHTIIYKYDEFANEAIPVSKRPYSVWSKSENLQKALEDILQKRKSVKSAAEHYKIPIATLYKKASGKRDLTKLPGRETVLSGEEESVLANWAIKMSQIGYGRTKFQVLRKVKEMISKEGRRNPFRDGTPGRRWWYGFIRRNPQVKLKTPEPIQIERAKACTPTTITNWFRGYRDFLANLNMLDGSGDRIWSYDESCFPLCPESGKILASTTLKNVIRITGSSKSQITVLCAVSASGNFLPPYQVYGASHCTFNPLENGVEGARFAISKSGWMTTEIFYSWVADHFIPSLPPARPVVLLIDGHTSHIDPETSQLCADNQIELYCLPPHASHIVQPLDVSVFKSMILNWKMAVHQFLTYNHGAVVDDKKFSLVYKKCFEATMSAELILDGFRSSGIYPCNRNAIDESKLNPSLLYDGQNASPPRLEAEPQLNLESHFDSEVVVPNIEAEFENQVELERDTEGQNPGDRPHFFGKTGEPLSKALEALESLLGTETVKEFNVMIAEGYDLFDPFFDSWKTLRKNLKIFEKQAALPNENSPASKRQLKLIETRSRDEPSTSSGFGTIPNVIQKRALSQVKDRISGLINEDKRGRQLFRLAKHKRSEDDDEPQNGQSSKKNKTSSVVEETSPTKNVKSSYRLLPIFK